MVKTKDAVNDMTVGTPAKLIIQFMIPVFLGNMAARRSSFITWQIRSSPDSSLGYGHWQRLEVRGL